MACIVKFLKSYLSLASVISVFSNGMTKPHGDDHGGQIVIDIPVDAQNVAESSGSMTDTVRSSSHHSPTPIDQFSFFSQENSHMAVMVDFFKSLLASVISFFANGENSHDEVPETAGGQIPITIPAATADASQNAAEAVRASIFELMCLIIPYEEGNAAAPAADKRKKILFQLVVPFCCAWAVGLPFFPEEIRLQNEFKYSLLSIIFSLAFSNILIANLICDQSRATSHGFMVTGVLFGVTAFFMAISIPLSMPLAGAVWFIYISTIIVIVAV